MKIGTLRKWDMWVGRPLCLLLTAAYRVKKVFFKKGAITNPRKILFIKLFGMGSIILAIPCINAVRKRYPGSSLYFLTFKENEEVFGLTGIIPREQVITVRKDDILTLFADIGRTLFLLIRERIDVVIDLEFFSRFTAILSFFIRSRYRIGFFGFHTEGLKRGNFIDFQINYNHTLHTSRAFFTLLKPLGIMFDEYSPSLPSVPPSEGYRQRLISLVEKASGATYPSQVKKWVVINPNTSDLIELRKWPDRHFLELTGMLIEDDTLGVIFIGSRSERAYTESLCACFAGSPDNRVVNLAGMTGLRDLIDLFYFSDLFITNDSGPAHVSSLTNIPSLVLFGPETPDLYAPLGPAVRCLYKGLDCQPCVTIYNSKLSYCRDNLCLQQIVPAEVYELARSYLAINEISMPGPDTCL